MFLQRRRATTSHLVCCCIKLWHHPGLIVSRPGEGCVFILFYFPFFAKASVAQDPAKADYPKRCMMSCRRSMQRQNLVTNFPGSCSSFCCFLSYLSSVVSISLPLQRESLPLFFYSDNIWVPFSVGIHLIKVFVCGWPADASLTSSHL